VRFSPDTTAEKISDFPFGTSDVAGVTVTPVTTILVSTVILKSLVNGVFLEAPFAIVAVTVIIHPDVAVKIFPPVMDAPVVPASLIFHTII